ncbi:MAG: hypothetical protein VKL42_00930 [Snowella sp.]|nr:hypothetical protein [Snowella sp.]
MATNKRLGKRNPLQLFPNAESGIENQESGLMIDANEAISPVSGEDKPTSTPVINQESGIENQENVLLSETPTKIKTPESLITNQESGIRNPEKMSSSVESMDATVEPMVEVNPHLSSLPVIKNQESGIENQENTRLYNLSVRVPEVLNDALDDAVKKTRRNIGQKIRKERLVAIAIEALLAKVEQAGGWETIRSEEDLANFLR